MRLPLIMILLGASMPGQALAQAGPAQPAQSAAPAAQQGTSIKPAARLQPPAARKKQAAQARNWSLDKAMNKKQGQLGGQQQAQVAGPAMPPEPVVKVPRQRTAKAAPRDKKPRVNAAPLVNTILRGKRHN